MRKIITLGLCAFFVTAFSGQVLAGKVGVCEDAKDELKSKQLYGLCNAYWKAGNDNARAKILANFEKKAGPGGPGMPGLEPEPESNPTCPCWDFDALVQTLACGGIGYSFSTLDETGDGSSYDSVIFEFIVQLYAGNTFFDFYPEQTECNVLDASGGDFLLAQSAPTSDGEDAACRMDVLDLIAAPPQPNECLTP